MGCAPAGVIGAVWNWRDKVEPYWKKVKAFFGFKSDDPPGGGEHPNPEENTGNPGDHVGSDVGNLDTPPDEGSAFPNSQLPFSH